MDHLRKKKPTTKRVPILLDPDLADQLSEARNAFDLARIRYENAPQNADRSDEFDAAKARYDELLDATRSEVVEFVFRGIGRHAWELLVDEHRPTKEQQDKHRRANPKAGPLEWNPETFPVAAVAASLSEPELTAGEVQEIWDDPDWNDAELAALFFAALESNQQRKVVDLT
jgi:hypothetical protein